MSSPPTPLHLLFLGHPLAYNLIHGRLDKTRADPFAVSITFAIVRNESPVSVDVGMEFLDRLAQFPCRFVPALEDGRLQIHLDELQLFEGLKDIAMPEIPFAVLDQFQHCLSELMFLLTFTNFYRQAFGGLIQHCESHRKMKPIEQMFGFRAQIQLQVAYVLPAVGEEDYLLIFLHPLRLQQFKQTPLRLRVERLDKGQAFAGFFLHLLLPTK